jgi:hypothetical protein
MTPNAARQRGFSEDYVVDRPVAATTSRTPGKGPNSNRSQQQVQGRFYEDEYQDELNQFQEGQVTPSQKKQQRQQQQIKRSSSKQQLQQPESPKLNAPSSPMGTKLSGSGSSNNLRKLQSA